MSLFQANVICYEMLKCNVRYVSCALVLAAAMATAASALAEVSIQVLSNRADMISGGDALVEVVMPPGLKINPALASSFVTGDVDGVPLASGSIAPRTDGRVYGLVTGLKNGNNVLTSGRRRAAPRSPLPTTL